MKFYCNDDTANRDVQIETPEEMLAIPRQDFKYNLIYLKEKKKTRLHSKRITSRLLAYHILTTSPFNIKCDHGHIHVFFVIKKFRGIYKVIKTCSLRSAIGSNEI